MVSPVGLNTSINTMLPQFGRQGLSFGSNNSLTPNPTSPAGCDYTNDVLMSGVDFTKLATAAIQQTAAQNNNVGQVQVPQNNTNTGQQETELADEQESEGSNIAKIIGATSGFLAPLAGKLYSWAKGGDPKVLFKFKQLAVTCPVLAVAGLGIGMLTDACIDATKSANLAKTQKPVQNIPQGINAVA